jgi:hypothetical protein
LRKRPAASSKLAQEQSSDESYDVSVHVRMTPRRQLGAGPQRMLAPETPESTRAMSGPLEFGLKLPATALSNLGDKFQVQFPVHLTSHTHRDSQPSLSTPRTNLLKGTVLVPASPAQATTGIADVSAMSLDRDDSWIDSRIATSVLYDSSREGSPEASDGRILLSPLLSRRSKDNSGASLEKASDPQRSLMSDLDDKDSTPDVMVSASISLSLEESVRAATSRENHHAHEPPSKHTKLHRKAAKTDQYIDHRLHTCG